MSYITNNDIAAWMGSEAYVELTDDEVTGAADEKRVDEARLGAEGEANSYLATRYAVPVSIAQEPEVEAVLRSFILDLATYRLHSRRPPVPPDIVRRREDAVTWLGRVASGIVQLPSAAAVSESGSLGTLGESVGPRRTMTRDTLENM